MTPTTAQPNQVTTHISFKMLHLIRIQPPATLVGQLTLVAMLSLSGQLAQSAATSSSSNLSATFGDVGGAESAASASSLADSAPPNELHFGAKLTLTLLAALISLVIVATLADYHTDASRRRMKRGNAKSSSHNGRTMLFSKRSEPAGLRDYRSLSMSSSCSSSLFCYTNSVASSSGQLSQLTIGNQTPAQAAHSAASQQQDTFSQTPVCAPADCLTSAAHQNPHQQQQQQQQQQQHYESNLQLHFNQAAGNVNKTLPSSVLAGKPAAQFCDHESNKRQDLLSAPVAAHHRSDCSIMCSAASSSSSERLVARRAELAALAGQILLAFSLRQSARQIFASCRAHQLEEAPAPRSARGDKWATLEEQQQQRQQQQRAMPEPMTPPTTMTFVTHQQNNVSHKPLSCSSGAACACFGKRQEAGAGLASLATLGANVNANISKTGPSGGSHTDRSGAGAGAANSEPRAPHESIDSLHGLRFLSMIWVIVIHSYNFALRWMFFSNATTLDSIYKSVASQLIANGSFACDSFFFAGGFLLPYSAFVAQTGEPAGDEPADGAGFTGTTSGAGGGGGGRNLPVNSKPACDQQVASLANVSERLASGSNCSCWPCCCSSSIGIEGIGSSASCCCYCAQQQRPQLHACCRSALVDAGAGAASASPAQRARAADEADTDNISPRPSELVARPCQVAPMALVNNTANSSGASQQVACCWQRQRAQQDLNTNELASDNKKCAPTPMPMPTSAASNTRRRQPEPLTLKRILANILHRYARMMPLMMALIGLCASLLRYLGEGPLWADSTLMYDGWCRKNWWINAMFLHNFLNRENMCLSHSWYSAVDLQLFLVGQLVLFVLSRSRRVGMVLLVGLIGCSQLITLALTLAYKLPAVPLVSSVDERTMNLYYGQIYIKPYCRASPYLIGILLAYLMRTTQLKRLQLRKWQVALGWTLALAAFATIILAMQPAMNGHSLSALESALYSALSRPIWALATGWMIFACITKRAGLVARILAAPCFVPLSKLTYPAFLVHPIVMALFYGSRQSSFHFSHYLMLYLILGNIVITYASAFILAALFELPMLSVERLLSGRWFGSPARR